MPGQTNRGSLTELGQGHWACRGAAGFRRWKIWWQPLHWYYPGIQRQISHSQKALNKIQNHKIFACSSLTPATVSSLSFQKHSSVMGWWGGFENIPGWIPASLWVLPCHTKTSTARRNQSPSKRDLKERRGRKSYCRDTYKFYVETVDYEI